MSKLSELSASGRNALQEVSHVVDGGAFRKHMVNHFFRILPTAPA